MSETERVVWLAALLHDIGKLRERTFEPPPPWATAYRNEARYSHEPLSAVFVEEFAGSWTGDPHGLRRLVLKHHAPDLPDERLVALADWLSAYERAEAKGDQEGARGRADTALRTVLSRVQAVGGGLAQPEEPRYHPLAKLSPESGVLMPAREPGGSPEAYRALWQGFRAEAGMIRRGDPTTLLALLRKYTWSVPSDTRRDTLPDVSLYHHLKSAAAIAACLARAGLSEAELKTLSDGLVRLFQGEALSEAEVALLDRPLCALVKGDISGTQDFLYLLTSSGAARGLRGRSFYLQLLTEVIALHLLRRCGLSPAHLIFAGGGHFYLLLPYREAEQSLPAWRQEIARRLWKAHQGDLALTLGMAPVAALDFLESEAGGNAFAEKWAEVSLEVAQGKQRKWADLQAEGMMDALFRPVQRGTTAEEMCQVCHGQWREGVDRRDDDVRKCRRCAAFEELGRRLRDPSHLILFETPEQEPPANPTWQETLRSFGVVARLVRQDDEALAPPDGCTGATVYIFDSTDFFSPATVQRFRWGDLAVSYDFRLLADATPVGGCDEAGQPVIADFADLAGAAQGVPWLGVLRMDVDNLGEIFRCGLGSQATLSRMTTLSESLRLFFEGRVPQLCREFNRWACGQGDQAYLIYAGGDDLFVVGAWSALPELARAIRDEFRAFVGSDRVTLSGGIAIEHRKYPLYQLAEDARQALDDQAKAFARPHGGHAKDALCFLQEPIGWERFAAVADWKQQLLAMLEPSAEQRPLPRALLTRLMEIHALYLSNAARQRRLRRQGQIRSELDLQEAVHFGRWQWQLAYQMKRFQDRYRDRERPLAELQRALVDRGQGLMPVLRVLARWVELLTRREENHGAT